MRTLVIPLLATLAICACAPEDPFSAPAIELRNRLQEFERSKEPEDVIEWMNGYHGEASGMHLFHTFIEWGNQNVELMNDLLADWPDDERARIYENLRWNAKDAELPLNFEVPE